MGGIGSGRRPAYDARQWVERCFALDVGELSGAPVEPARSGAFEIRSPLVAWGVQASYLIRHDGFNLVWTLYVPTMAGVVSMHIDLDRYQLPYGGQRVYLRCPGLGGPECASRVAKLYWPLRGGGFACRRCHRLAYRKCQSRRERKWLELLRVVAAADRAGGGGSGSRAARKHG